MKKIFPLLALATLAACGGDDDNGIGPGDPVRSCNVGSIDVNGTREFTLGAGFGCKTRDIWGSTVDSVYGASYTVNLQAGTAYSFTAFDRNDAGTSEFDLTMALFGPGEDTTSYGWIAGSDDQGVGASGYNSQIVVVPKVTGRYTIRVAGFSELDEGPVRLTVRSCGTATTLGTSAVSGSVPASACVIDGVKFVVHQFQATAGAARTIVVHSTAFQPAVIVGGPGEDIWDEGDLDNLDPQPQDIASGDDAVVSFTAPRTGTYTVLVGSFSGEAGAYSVQLLNTPMAASVSADVQLVAPSAPGKVKRAR